MFSFRSRPTTWFLRGHPETGGDILFVNKATPGRVCLVPRCGLLCIGARTWRGSSRPGQGPYLKMIFSPSCVRQLHKEGAKKSRGCTLGYAHLSSPSKRRAYFDKLFLPLPGSEETESFIGDIYFARCPRQDRPEPAVRTRRWRRWRARSSSRGSWTSTPSAPNQRAEGSRTIPGLPKPPRRPLPRPPRSLRTRRDSGGVEAGPLDSVLVLQRGFDFPATERTSGAYPCSQRAGQAERTTSTR